MSDYLLRHAIENIWCAPDQDDNAIFKLARLTDINGVINKHKLNYDTIVLPKPQTKFHLFNIGQVHHSILNLFDVKQQWELLSDCCNKNDLLLNLYTTKGIELPRIDSWYMVTKTNDLIVAVKKNDRIDFDFNKDDIYLRTYHNSYFQSSRFIGTNEKIVVYGKVVKTNADIINVQTKLASYINKTGLVNCFINGYKQNTISLVNTIIGDVVEFVYDSSIKTVIDFNLANLPTFDSILDNKGKYLLHYPGTTNVIDYNDDIDIYLVNKITGKGVWVNKNKEDTFRNLTHKDYSITTSYIHSYFEKFKVNGHLDINNLVIRLHVKYSGYERALCLEKNRINELYKLNDNLIVNALLGVNSNVSVWRADYLENCSYVKLMKASFNQINNNLLTDVYGYDGIADLLAYTPKQVSLTGNQKYITVPLLLRNSCTAFEYDSNGLLLEFHYHTDGEVYLCRNTNTTYVETFLGLGTDRLSEQVGLNTYALTNNCFIRVYACDLVNGLPNNQYIDVTNTTGLSTLQDPTKYCIVRDDKQFLLYQTTISLEEGVFEFPIEYYQNKQGIISKLEMIISMGELEVFLNGRLLIENLDYYYSNPKIVIVNKSYLNHTSSENIVIRFTGFCNNQLKHNTCKEFGFIQRSNVSDNHRYNIKDNKLQHISVNGYIKLLDQVSYYDDVNSGSVFNNDNGKPYQIKPIVVPLGLVSDKDTYTLISEEASVDQEVTDYITYNVNQVSSPILSVVNSRHVLYSPFLARVLNELLDGFIDPNILSNRYDDEFVRSVCKDYLELLQYDPINLDNQYSKDYIVVHPHAYNSVLVLPFDQFKFFTNVVRLYANNVDIKNSIRLQ